MNAGGGGARPAATGTTHQPREGVVQRVCFLLKVRDEAPYVQLYFDTAFGQSVGGAMNERADVLSQRRAPQLRSKRRFDPAQQ